MTSLVLWNARLFVFLATGVLAPRAFADVLTVDAQGGANFTDIQPAVDFASERDIVLVRSGIYGQVTVEGKSLTVAAAYAGTVRTGTVRISDLAQEQRVLLSGLDVRSTAPHAQGALSISQCQGTVRADECSFGKLAAYSFWRGAWIEHSRDVAFHRCSFLARRGTSMGYLYPGIDARDSVIGLYDCESEGASSSATLPPGGAGLRASASFLFMQGSTFQGGNGGDGDCGETPADGGPGIHLMDGTEAHAFGCAFMGGYGGISGGVICKLHYGEDGPPVLLEGGAQLFSQTTTVRRLDLPSVLQPAERFPLRATAVPGDEIFAVRGLDGGFRWFPDLLGVALLDPPQPERGLLLGTSDGGETTFVLTVPQISQEDGESILVQLRTVDSLGNAFWGGGEFVTVVDAELDGVCQRPIFVDRDAPPGGDGSSWESAVADLQQGLDHARELFDGPCPNVQPAVWVAEGTYIRPTPGSFDEVFWISAPMAVYGGFAGHETTLEERDPDRYPTILSGDQNGDDGPGFQNYDDNSETVLLVLGFTYQPPETAVIVDGFTIRGGNGHSGAGIRFHAGTLLIRNSHIVENLCSGRGAGLLAGYPTTVTLVDCELARNHAEGDGGGVCLLSGGQISACMFRDNFSGQRGGGLYLEANPYFFPQSLVVSSLFTANHAGEGGGIFAFTDHSSESLRIAGCTVFRNEGQYGPGGIRCVRAQGALSVADSILWGNRRGGLAGEDAQIAGTGEAIRCCIEHWAGGFPGQGNFGLDPRLDPDLRLEPGSPCIDAGWNSWIPADVLDLDSDVDAVEPWPFDLDGEERLVDDPTVPDTGEGAPPTVDIGAFERQ